MAGIDSFTKLILHCDGADASTTFLDSSTEQAAKTMTPVSTVEIDTAQSVFGGASGLFGGGYLTTPDDVDFDMGTGDWSIDFRVRFNVSTATARFCGANDNAGTNTLHITWLNSNTLRVFLQANAYNFAWTPAADTWYHIAVTRSGTNLRVFINGTQIGVTQSSSDNIVVTTVFAVGSDDAGNTPLSGWIDEFRVSKGIARWTADFTPPTEAYSGASSYISNMMMMGVS